MRRVLLVALAAAFFAWQNVAFVLWLRASGDLGTGLAHAWAALRQDMLVLLVMTDAGMFIGCAAAWLWRDLRGTPLGRRALWFAGTCLIGSPVLLLYLAYRPRRETTA